MSNAVGFHNLPLEPVVGYSDGLDYIVQCSDGDLRVEKPDREQMTKMSRWPKFSLSKAKLWASQAGYDSMPQNMSKKALDDHMNTKAFKVIVARMNMLNSGMPIEKVEQEMTNYFSTLSDREFHLLMAESGFARCDKPELVALKSSDPEFSPTMQTLLETESMIGKHLWATSMAMGASVFSQRICPTAFVNSVKTVTGGEKVDAGYLHMFGQMTRFWKGSIIVRVRVIKTKHHKGSLVFWLSRLQGTTFQNSEHIVVDISDEDEFDLKLNFDSTKWLQNHQHVYELRCAVYSCLGAPEASSVTVLVTSRAGEDFAFSGIFPRPTHIVPVSKYLAPSPDVSLHSPDKDARVQPVIGSPKRVVPMYHLGKTSRLDDSSQEPIKDLHEFLFREIYSSYTVSDPRESSSKHHRFPLCHVSSLLASCHKAWDGVVQHILTTSSNTMERGRVIMETASTRGGKSDKVAKSGEIGYDAIISPLNSEVSFSSKRISNVHYTLLSQESKQDTCNRVKVTVLSSQPTHCHYDINPRVKFMFATAAPELLIRSGMYFGQVELEREAVVVHSGSKASFDEDEEIDLERFKI
jgi:hypothetical protein